MTPNGTSPAQLKSARNILLKLHKTLLDNERDNYERERGRINSTNEYLNLVLNDEQFAWLRTMSGLIVQIDEAFDQKDPRMDEEAALLLGAQMRNLLNVNKEETAFAVKYKHALNQSKTAAAQHQQIVQQLDGLLGKEV